MKRLNIEGFMSTADNETYLTGTDENGNDFQVVFSTIELLESIAGELNTLPDLLLEAIREDEGAVELVREYGRGNSTYDDILDYINGII